MNKNFSFFVSSVVLSRVEIVQSIITKKRSTEHGSRDNSEGAAERVLLNSAILAIKIKRISF